MRVCFFGIAFRRGLNIKQIDMGKKKNAYVLFAEEIKDELEVEAGHSLSLPQMIDLASERWMNLPEDVKAQYKSLAKGEASGGSEQNSVGQGFPHKNKQKQKETKNQFRVVEKLQEEGTTTTYRNKKAMESFRPAFLDDPEECNLAYYKTWKYFECRKIRDAESCTVEFDCAFTAGRANITEESIEEWIKTRVFTFIHVVPHIGLQKRVVPAEIAAVSFNLDVGVIDQQSWLLTYANDDDDINQLSELEREDLEYRNGMHRVVIKQSDLTMLQKGYFVSSVKELISQLKEISTSSNNPRRIFVVMGCCQNYNFVSGTFGWLGDEQRNTDGFTSDFLDKDKYFDRLYCADSLVFALRNAVLRRREKKVIENPKVIESLMSLEKFQIQPDSDCCPYHDDNKPNQYHGCALVTALIITRRIFELMAEIPEFALEINDESHLKYLKWDKDQQQETDVKHLEHNEYNDEVIEVELLGEERTEETGLFGMVSHLNNKTLPFQGAGHGTGLEETVGPPQPGAQSQIVKSSPRVRGRGRAKAILTESNPTQKPTLGQILQSKPDISTDLNVTVPEFNGSFAQAIVEERSLEPELKPKTLPPAARNRTGKPKFFASGGTSNKNE